MHDLASFLPPQLKMEKVVWPRRLLLYNTLYNCVACNMPIELLNGHVIVWKIDTIEVTMLDA